LQKCDYHKAVTYPNHCILCQQNSDELEAVYKKKFPDKLIYLQQFLSAISYLIEVIPMTTNVIKEEKSMRAATDRPIIRTAIKTKVDIIITGDKDFLESGLVKPCIITAADFLNMDINNI
jgi:uncharacterized protein